MKLFTVPNTNIRVLFRTRGEHRPPHVHAVNREVPWEAKIRFSFVEDDDIEVLEIDPEENWPSASTIREVVSAIHNQLTLVRYKWWDTFGTVCLDGKWIRELPPVDGQPTFEVLTGHQSGAMRVKSVVFLSGNEPGEETLHVTLCDGRDFKAPAGSGRDRSDKD